MMSMNLLERKKHKKNLVVEYLQGRSLDAREIEEATNVSQSAMNNYIRELIAEKRIHVCGWREKTYRKILTAVYSAGDLPNIPPPRGQGGKTKMAKSGAKARLMKSAWSNDPMMAAFYGRGK